MSKVPKILSVVVESGGHALLVGWEDGTTDRVDLSGPIERFAVYAPLDNPGTFARAVVGEWGRYVAWPLGGDGEVDMAGYTLWRLAREQAGEAMPVDTFKALRRELGLTQEELGRRLGLSKRMIIHYENGTHIVPKAIGLALLAVRHGLTLPPGGRAAA